MLNWIKFGSVFIAVSGCFINWFRGSVCVVRRLGALVAVEWSLEYTLRLFPAKHCKQRFSSPDIRFFLGVIWEEFLNSISTHTHTLSPFCFMRW